MNKIKNIFLAVAVLFSANALQSCSDNDDNYDADQMIAVVTVRPRRMTTGLSFGWINPQS